MPPADVVLAPLRLGSVASARVWAAASADVPLHTARGEGKANPTAFADGTRRTQDSR